MSKKSTISIILTTAAVAAAGYYIFSRKSKPKEMTNNMGNKNLPRGYRNNNPLNIRLNSANNWQGKVLPNTDGVFEQFSSMEYGYRAALRLIQNYIKAGNTTITQIISKWAPNNENNTAGYISRVCSTLDALPATVIEANDKQAMCKLVYAMAIVENGNTPLPSIEQIYDGWNLI